MYFSFIFRDDMFAEDSIELLKASGIDFELKLLAI